MSSPRSTPGARGDELRARRHADMIGQPLRTFRSTRAGLSFHDQLRRLAKILLARRPFRIIGKTSSTLAAARIVPWPIRGDSTSPSWDRSDKLRSMFSVFLSFFRASLEREERLPGNAKVGVSQLGHSSTIVARARAVRMSPGGVPEAQGARHSGQTEGRRPGLSARRNPRRG